MLVLAGPTLSARVADHAPSGAATFTDSGSACDQPEEPPTGGGGECGNSAMEDPPRQTPDDKKPKAPAPGKPEAAAPAAPAEGAGK